MNFHVGFLARSSFHLFACAFIFNNDPDTFIYIRTPKDVFDWCYIMKHVYTNFSQPAASSHSQGLRVATEHTTNPFAVRNRSTSLKSRTVSHRANCKNTLFTATTDAPAKYLGFGKLSFGAKRQTNILQTRLCVLEWHVRPRQTAHHEYFTVRVCERVRDRARSVKEERYAVHNNDWENR